MVRTGRPSLAVLTLSFTRPQARSTSGQDQSGMSRSMKVFQHTRNERNLLDLSVRETASDFLQV